MRRRYDFSKGRRNNYCSMLPAPRLSAKAKRQLKAGIRVEMEHTTNRALAQRIASHHLAEAWNYYILLNRMERGFKKNPYGRNPGARTRSAPGNLRASKSGVCLGRLDELVFETQDGIGQFTPEQLRGLFVAWIPSGKRLAIVRKAKGIPGQLDSATRQVHQQFHDSAPARASVYQEADPVGRQHTVALIRSLTYVVPQSIKSPQKHGYKWVHAFGDHGESGHGPLRREKTYPDALKPLLITDDAGNFWIKRRAGNKFNVTDWIYW